MLLDSALNYDSGDISALEAKADALRALGRYEEARGIIQDTTTFISGRKNNITTDSALPVKVLKTQQTQIPSTQISEIQNEISQSETEVKEFQKKNPQINNLKAFFRRALNLLLPGVLKKSSETSARTESNVQQKIPAKNRPVLIRPNGKMTEL